jgi:Icc-related predicted phosphoesterase
MRILTITDLHGRSEIMSRILTQSGPVDLVLLGGDLTDFGSADDAQRFIRLAQEHGSPVLAVAGNCDSPAIERQLIDMGVSLHGQGVVREGVGLHGVSAMPPWRRGMYQFTEDELSEFLRAGFQQIAGADRHVLLSHPPPRNQSLDRTARGQHVGSTAVREFLDENRPDLVFCGHVHEGRGIERLGRTLAVNCGMGAAGSYAVAEVGQDVTVELCNAD